jgi:HD superfamily phosphodiesterase
MEIEKLQTFILEKLRKELPAWLSYHNVEHTEYVIRYAIELGEAENLSEPELKLLHTAAILHDTGFLSTYAGHEEASCGIARQYLP